MGEKSTAYHFGGLQLVCLSPFEDPGFAVVFEKRSATYFRRQNDRRWRGDLRRGALNALTGQYLDFDITLPPERQRAIEAYSERR